MLFFVFNFPKNEDRNKIGGKPQQFLRETVFEPKVVWYNFTSSKRNKISSILDLITLLPQSKEKNLT